MARKNRKRRQGGYVARLKAENQTLRQHLAEDDAEIRRLLDERDGALLRLGEAQQRLRDAGKPAEPWSLARRLLAGR